MTFQSWKEGEKSGTAMRDVMLQWGHDFSVMESHQALKDSRIRDLQLQWGHDFSVMERMQTFFQRLRDFVASMGP